MVTHKFTYCRLLPVQQCCGRSSLARSDIASSALRQSPIQRTDLRPPRPTLLRPPREDLLSQHYAGLVRTSQGKSPPMFEHSILARSDTASGAISQFRFDKLNLGPPRSTLLRPPREDLVRQRFSFLEKSLLALKCSVLARSDTAMTVGAKRIALHQWSSLPIRNDIMGEVCPYE